MQLTGFVKQSRLQHIINSFFGFYRTSFYSNVSIWNQEFLATIFVSQACLIGDEIEYALYNAYVVVRSIQQMYTYIIMYVCSRISKLLKILMFFYH